MSADNIKITAQLDDKASAQLKALRGQLDEFAKGVEQGAAAELKAFKSAQEGADKLKASFSGMRGNFSSVISDLNGIASGSGDAAAQAQNLVSALQGLGTGAVRGIGAAISGMFSNMKASGSDASAALQGVEQAASSSLTKVAAGAAGATLGFKGFKLGVAEAAKALDDSIAKQIAALSRLELAKKEYDERVAATKARREVLLDEAGPTKKGTRRQNLPGRSAAAAEIQAMRDSDHRFYAQNIGAGKDSVLMAQVEVGVARAQLAVSQFAAAAGPALASVAAGAAVVGSAIAAIALSARDAADKNAELAEKLGVTTTRLAALQVVAGENGGTAEGLVKVYDKLSKSLNKLDEDNAKSKYAFESLGTSLEEIGKLSKEEAAALLVKNFQDLGESTKATAAIAQLLGPGFRDQIPAIKAAANQMDEATKMVEHYGAVAPKEVEEAGGRQERALTQLSLAWKGFSNQVAQSTGEFVKSVVEGIAEALNAVRKFIKETGEYKARAENIKTNIAPERRAQISQQVKDEQAKGLIPSTNEAFIKRRLELYDAELAKVNEVKNATVAAETAKSTAEEDARKKKLKARSDAAKLPEKPVPPHVDPYQQAVEGLSRELATTKDITVYEKTLFETQQGRFKNFSDGQKEVLLGIAKQVDLRKQQEALDEKINKLIDEDVRKQHERAVAVKRQQEDQADALTLAEYEVSLAGKSADERERLVEAKKNELRLEKELRGLNPGVAADVRKTDAELTKRSDALREAAKEAQVVNGIVDNSRAAVTASVYDNITAAKKLLDQNKITLQDFTMYEADQMSRLERFASDYEKTWKEVAMSVQGSLQTFFFDAMQGQFDNVGDMFKKLIDRMVAQALAAKLTEALFGKAGTTGGGFAGAAASVIGSFFGGARAGGGGVEAGKTYLVGENGPELATFSANGHITPNDKLQSLGNTTHISFSVSAIDAASFRSKIDEFKRDIAMAVRDSQMSYGV